jgi:hypothetical protein
MNPNKDDNGWKAAICGAVIGLVCVFLLWKFTDADDWKPMTSGGEQKEPEFNAVQAIATGQGIDSDGNPLTPF